MNLLGSSQSLGGKSIRKFDFWIGVFLSGSSGSIRKFTSGSIRIYPKKSENSRLLHHSIMSCWESSTSGCLGSFLTSTNLTIFGEFRWIQVNSAEKSDWIHLNSVGATGRLVERNHHWIHLNSPKFIWIRSRLRMNLRPVLRVGFHESRNRISRKFPTDPRFFDFFDFRPSWNRK